MIIFLLNDKIDKLYAVFVQHSMCQQWHTAHKAVKDYDNSYSHNMLLNVRAKQISSLLPLWWQTNLICIAPD